MQQKAEIAEQIKQWQQHSSCLEVRVFGNTLLEEKVSEKERDEESCGEFGVTTERANT